ncbi:DUF6093 family protein [Streptomyces sp. NPDC000927]|uniref:DUF6093 family protein n=1 Tax=Streptomyces sp. NPDC000927 TaxID=3154371 RepID=UPI003325BC66
MSRLLSRRALDPRWPWHQRSAAIGHMNIVVEVFRRSGDVNDYGFDLLTGGLTEPDGAGRKAYAKMCLLYRGQARGVENKDWRARVRTGQGDSGTNHAVRFQIPIRLCPPVHAHDVIRVVSSPPNSEMMHFIFHVRTAMPSGNSWIRNLLCDVDVAHPQLLPPPHEGEPLDISQVPEPVMDCVGCG